MAITPKAREALEQAYYYESKGDLDLAELNFRIAARENSLAGGRGLERVQKRKGLRDALNAKDFAQRIRESNTPIEKPKMTAPLSIPSEESRTLIEDRSKPQQKNKAQQEKQNKTAEKPRNEKVLSDNAVELLKRAQESETKGNKKEAFRLLKEAADGGSEIAKAKVGQRYLKLAVRYLGRQAAFEKLGEKITPQQKDNKEKVSAAPKQHFRHQRNRVAELNGCGDMVETETSVLHSVKAEEKTWVGDEKKDSPPPPPQVIIQERVRYVNYWTGNDCLPELILVDRLEPVSCERALQTGHDFCAEHILWRADFAESPASEEHAPQNGTEGAPDEASKEDVCELCRWGVCTPFFRKLFSIFRKCTLTGK